MEYLKLSSAVQSALSEGNPVLALESTVITHGLPYPQNMEIARELEQIAIEQWRYSCHHRCYRRCHPYRFGRSRF